jgi:diguanylate cyclase (GGDEF)-like protein
MHLSNLKALSSALNAKDHYTLGHAARVSAYMVLMGRALGWQDDYLRQAEEAAYLHDIGKIGISDRVLLKPGQLNTQEWQLMRQHPVFSADIIRSLFDEEFVAGVRHHHERFEGGGYPDGITGAEMPLIARVMGVVDAYDAMSFQRPYRPARDYAGCLEELRACRGTQFDPEMVDVFLTVLDDLHARQDQADAIAHEAAVAVDPVKHALLRVPDDMRRAEYAEIVAQLRAVRDAHPSTRFVTTYACVDDRDIVVADSEESAEDFSPLGDELLMDINIDTVLRGIAPSANTLSADQFGVWITGIAPILDQDGTIVGAVTADLAPFGSGDAAGARRDHGQTLASMLQTAAARFSRAEIDAITDGLTGLYNHRYLHERLKEELERAAEQETSVSVLFADLDHFKQYNDDLGHSAGDRVLRAVAQVFEQSVRRVDLAARYGGEEFVAVLIDTDGSGAREVAERIRQAIRVATATPDHGDLTISIGISSFPHDGVTKEELLDKADWAMYLAKRRGRDRVEAFNPAEAAQPRA